MSLVDPGPNVPYLTHPNGDITVKGGPFVGRRFIAPGFFGGLAWTNGEDRLSLDRVRALAGASEKAYTFLSPHLGDGDGIGLPNPAEILGGLGGALADFFDEQKDDVLAFLDEQKDDTQWTVVALAAVAGLVLASWAGFGVPQAGLQAVVSVNGLAAGLLGKVIDGVTDPIAAVGRLLP